MIAQVQTDTLVRALLIALLVVSPYAVVKVRQVRARRAAASEAADPAADADPDPSDQRPRLEDVIAAIDEVAAERAAARTVLVPHDATVDGDAVPAAVADALVRDALARSGLVATGELDTPDGRLLECAPRSAAPGD